MEPKPGQIYKIKDDTSMIRFQVLNIFNDQDRHTQVEVGTFFLGLMGKTKYNSVTQFAQHSFLGSCELCPITNTSLWKVLNE